ncbi:PREDICTED: calcitonin-like [Condylura cristata]|uniref:calcitonin-like n=1 Tax=Condylura cristata TaxID=143302 RepID=UPI000334659A|nr:PREDICTED: calcitonin-like [Condylura cristata]
MGFWKFPPFLALSILVLIQVGFLQAAPIRAALESRPYPASLPEEDRRLLLIELVKAYMQMKASELEQERETRDSSLDVPKAKRCSSLSTCVLGAYTQDLNKYHTFPQTAVGVGAPGKKRVMAVGLKRDHGPHVGMPWDA